MLAAIPLYIFLPFIYYLIAYTIVVPASFIVTSNFTEAAGPIPPFRSPLSWYITRAYAIFFGQPSGSLNSKEPNVTALVMKCRSWDEFDDLWRTWWKTKPEDALRFPLTLSTAAVDSFNVTSKVLLEAVTQSTWSTWQVGRKLEVLSLTVLGMREWLPTPTMCRITDILLRYLVEIINSGASFDCIRPVFDLQGELPLDLVSNGTFSFLFIILCSMFLRHHPAGDPFFLLFGQETPARARELLEFILEGPPGFDP